MISAPECAQLEIGEGLHFQKDITSVVVGTSYTKSFLKFRL